MKTNCFSEEELKKELKIEARALEIPSGAADVFIDKTINAVKHNLASKKIITERDLNGAVYAELKKYNSDFAYVYKNRDKII